MACHTAADGFSNIVDKVGGEQEKIRARSVHTTHFQKHWPTNLNVVKYYDVYTYVVAIHTSYACAALSHLISEVIQTADRLYLYRCHALC